MTIRLLLLCFLVLVFSLPAVADEDKPPSEETSQKAPKLDPPIITYAQKVEIVVPIKKNPVVFNARVEQDGYRITLSLTVHNDLGRKAAKDLGKDFLIRTKNITLDDPPEKGAPGEGLYHYDITVIRANGKKVIAGTKKADEKTIEWFE